MNRLSFFKKAGAALALLLVSPLLLRAEPEFPEWENGLQMRKVYRNGKRIRMKDLKRGDVFELERDDLNNRGKREQFIAAEDASPTVVEGKSTWGIVAGPSNHCAA